MEVDAKGRVGDWEIDTVIGRGYSGVLVSIVEHVTQFTLSAQVKNKRTKEVTETTIALLKPYTAVLHTITVDNGKDFS